MIISACFSKSTYIVKKKYAQIDRSDNQLDAGRNRGRSQGGSSGLGLGCLSGTDESFSAPGTILGRMSLEERSMGFLLTTWSLCYL